MDERAGVRRGDRRPWVEAVDTGFVRATLVWLLFLLSPLCLGAQVAATLPIYLEENHAGSFHWLAQELDLETPHTLLHFDAHSDASAVPGSDEIRRLLREVASAEERAVRLERWRALGAVQCFDWIEPLMPAPFAQVVWVPGERLTRGSQAHRQKIARELLDTHEEAFPRAGGPVGPHYRVQSFEELRRAWRDEGTPLVVSIDLDYFAALPDAAEAAAFEQLWDWVSRRPNLRAVTLALSRPWLRDAAQAHRLLELALRGALSLPQAVIDFEPFRDAGPDRSQRARELRAAGQAVPKWRIEEAPESLRGLLLAGQERFRVGHQHERWRALLSEWAREAAPPTAALHDRRANLGGVWRVPVTEPAVAVVTDVESGSRIEWFALVPQHWRCNLLARDDSWTGFAAGAVPRPRWRERPLGEGRTLDLADRPELFEAARGCGSVRVFARVRDTAGRMRETRAIEVRRVVGEGLMAELSGQFGLPYLLGGNFLRDGPRRGPETGWGADCASFVVAGLRATGRFLPWSDPKQLRAHLRELAIGCRPGEARFTAKQAAAGLLVHLGSHVAALVEDRPPLGVLDASDLVAHQLEGAPEFLTLGRLLGQRKAAAFDLYTAAEAEGERILLGGDVMLGRSLAPAVERGENVLAGLATVVRRADLWAVNLECVPSAGGEPVAGRRYHLRAPPSAASMLHAAGVRWVGLANNHADDFGDEGLSEALSRLRAAGLGVAGAGSNAAEAFAPILETLPSGRRVALVAVSAVPGASGLSRLHLARAADRGSLANALAEARQQAELVVALVHWGLEGVEEPGEEQLELARWLIAQGVQAIAGAHPHRRQPLECFAGVPVAFSLGNLVFDGAPQVPWWNAGALLELRLGAKGLTSARLIPVELKEGRPFPVRGGDGDSQE